MILSAIETMTNGALIVKFIEIVIIIFAIIAIFEIAINSKAIRKEQEEQTKLLKEIKQNTLDNNMIMIQQDKSNPR